MPVDDGIRYRREQVSGGDDIGPAEEYQAIPIGVGCRYMDDLDTFSIEKPVFVGRESFFRPRVERSRALPARGRTHFFQYVLMRDDGRRFRQTAGKDIGELQRNRIAGFANRHVPACVIRMEVGIDNVSDRLVRDSPDGGQQLRTESGVLRIDDSDGMLVYLYCLVAAGPD